MTTTWKRCNACKKDIAFAAEYYVCSVSTCTKKRGGYVFCSVPCWETHVPMMRHREAWAVEEKSPTQAEWAAQQDDDDAPAPARMSGSTSGREEGLRRRVVAAPSVTTAAAAAEGAAAREVLVVVSRFKAYVRQRWGMNTSDGVFENLSDHLRVLARRAVDNARAEGRKTLLERDFDFLEK